MKKNQSYKLNEQGDVVLPGPRSTNEIFVSDMSKGALPNNEKDASAFSLISEASVLSSLKSLYAQVEGYTFPHSTSIK